MTDIAALLDRYPDLSLQERAAVDARVRDLPEWAAAHREACAFAALLDAADPTLTADDLARAAVNRRMGHPLPDAHAPRRAGADHPDLDAEADRIETRLDELEAGMADPLELFQALTGLELPPPVAGGDSSARAFASPVRAPERAPARGSARRLPVLARWVAGVAVAAVAYGGLFAASALTATPREQVAALGEVRMEEAPVLRGADAVVGADALGPALDAVRGARRSTLGLFPHYDATALDAAADDLTAVAETAAPASWVSQEARLALGRVHLYRERDAEAVRVLGGLVREGSYRAGAARRMIDWVRAGG